MFFSSSFNLFMANSLLLFAGFLFSLQTVAVFSVNLKLHQMLVQILQRKVGRLLFNGYPTGVEVGHAMQHGGPYPASTDSRSTSVGTAAITRFARPICFQNFPIESLPPALRDENVLGI